MDFLVARDDPRSCRFADEEAPEPAEGEALLRVGSFGLTSNNVTYALLGDALDYWSFFPAEDGWGKLPVWGFAQVVKSRAAALDEGVRVFGYLPLSTQLVVVPDRIDRRGFVDAAPHRAHLPAAYQRYRSTDADPAYDPSREGEQILFWPLFYTSFLLDDLLAEEGFFGARSILLSSASSKTALIAAFLLRRRSGPELVGLTSPGNADFVRRSGVYDEVALYGEVESLERRGTVYVDLSGDGAVRGAVHAHFGELLTHSAAVGMTHWDRVGGPGGSDLPGPKPVFFFAPDRARQRSADWGRAELDARVTAAWAPFVEWTGGWLHVRRAAGPEAIRSTYLELLDGRTDPAVGHVLSLTGD
ncbi:MAG: hypothetical protein K0T00_1631 [Gaiellaceae bacterium]|nr:hypothetical protein [Gaiellaceae bacterium]